MQIFVPTVSALVQHDGRRIHLVRGRTTVEEGHPIMEGRASMFRPITINHPVEKAAPKKKSDKGKDDEVQEGGEEA